MKLTNTQTKKSNKGMTLIELTVVILVLLSLISVLFIGARAWLRGSDRAAAAILIRNAQQGVRSQTNIIGLDTPASANATPAGVAYEYAPAFMDLTGTAATNSLDEEVFGPGAFVEVDVAGTLPTHPANGVTFVHGPSGAGFVPPLETLYITSDSEPAFLSLIHI